jgi:hypothetical protein
MRELPKPRVRLVHPLAWVIEPLEREPSLVVRAMFGGRAVYVRGRFVLFLAARPAEPWRGVLVPTEREHQAALIAARPALRPHAVLPKWLYLPEAAASFERDAAWLVAQVRAGDPRLGIEPGQKTRAPRKRQLKRATVSAHSRP